MRLAAWTHVRRPLVRITLAAWLMFGLALIAFAADRPVQAMDSSQVRAMAGRGFNLWLPPAGQRQEPIPVVLAIHGMGATGEMVAKGLIEEAGKRGWILIAPTFRYGDWRDSNQLVQDDLRLSLQLIEILDALPGQIGLQVQPRALIYGFSRGSQLAHRFAFYYPERVRGIVGFSGGTYTLPRIIGPDGATPLNLPFGLADAEPMLGRTINWRAMRRVRFLVGVGGNDNREADVPRRWDPYLGKNRVERARAFHAALLQQGIPARLTIFPDTGHTVTPRMREATFEFFQSLVREDQASAKTLH